MRMLKPSPGELADRQTILQLKMEHAQPFEEPKRKEQYIKGTPDPAVREDKVSRVTIKGASKIDIKPFHDEHELIQKYLEEFFFPNIAADTNRQKQFDAFHDNLFEVNGKLWKLEDQARVLRAAPDKFQEVAAKRAAEVLFMINDLNDERAALVKKINEIWNIVGQEKMYA